MRPYGYAPDRRTLRDHEAEMLRAAAEKILDGEAVRAVAVWMNEQGARTPSGNMWQPNVLRRLLINPRIAALVERDGKLRKADWPAVIDRDTHKRLVDRLGPKRGDDAGGPQTRTYLLTGGLATCGLCGKPLVARPNNNGRRGYVCAGGLPFGGCGRIRITAEPFEEYVAERVLARVATPENQAAVKATLDAVHAAADAAQAQLAAGKARLEELGRDYADGLIGATEFHSAQKRIRERMDEARRAAEIRDDAERLAVLDVDQLVEWWNDATLEQQRAVVALLVEDVTVKPALRRGSKLFDPSRVRIRWR